MLRDIYLRALKPGQTATDPSARGDIGLEVKRLTSGGLSQRATYSSRETDSKPRRTHRIVLGTNLGLLDARDARDALRARIADLRQRYPGLARENDLRGMLAADDAERAAKDEAAKQMDEQRRSATLAALMAACVADLQARKRIYQRAVESSINKHIIKAHPDLAAKAAAEITLDDCLEIVRAVVDNGHTREAAKIRSYMRAVYTSAVRARQRSDGLPALTALRLKDNLAANLATLDGGQGTPGERALTLTELQAYWRRIQGEPLLLLHLLTGGQRLAQLAKATTADLDRQKRTLLLRDPKGRRKVACLHVVPLLDEALAAIDAMRPEVCARHYVFTVSAGKYGASYKTAVHAGRLAPDG